MKDLFAQIEALHPRLDGWCPLDKACILASMVLAIRPKVTVEIGVFGGKSFLPMAMAHRHLGIGMAYGIDPWQKAESIKGQDAENMKWWGMIDHEKVFNKFMAHVTELGVQNVVKIARMQSDNFRPIPTMDICHLDGNHGPQAVKDVERFAPHIRVGGFCVMDDLNWTGGNVGKAAEKLVGMGFAKLYELGTGAVFQKIA